MATKTFEPFAFMEKYHPNYSGEDNIAHMDDIQKFIDDEYDPNDPQDSGAWMATAFGGDKYFAAVEAQRLYCQEMLRAIDNYYKEKFCEGAVILPY